MQRFLPLLLALSLAAHSGAWAQGAPPAPAVGVTTAKQRAITETTEFVGRIHAVERVDLSARVTAFLDERLFSEGSEVNKGELVYRLEQAPFEAEVQAKQAAAREVEAQLKNTNLAFARARRLVVTGASSVASVDAAEANHQSRVAQLLAAQAELCRAQINLAYTEIRAPISGKIGMTTVTPGNVVGPNSGVLTTIVSQDPMYVIFSVPVRTALALRERMARDGGFDSLKVRVRLPDGRLYEHAGKLNFLNNSVAGSTDTLTMRATIPNPIVFQAKGATGASRELVDGEFVTVLLEGAKPVEVLTVPRSALLSDQSGDYVYVVDAQSKAEQQHVKLGQSTPTLAVITNGLKAGQTVIVDGLQRVRPGQPVSPGPAAIPAGDLDAKNASDHSDQGDGAPENPTPDGHR